MEDKGVHTFPNGICPKVNVIARLEYELVYYDSAVHRFNHYTTRTPPIMLEAKIDNTRQDIKCELCCDRDETVNRIISEYNELAQKKTRHDLAGQYDPLGIVQDIQIWRYY